MRKFSIISLSFGFVLLTGLANAQENRMLFSSLASPQQGGDNNKGQIISTRFDIGQNSPNPFSDFTQIEYSNPVQGFVELKVVNLIGKELYHRVLEAEAGRNLIRLEGEDFTPGVYIYSLSNGTQTITRRMVISKK